METVQIPNKIFLEEVRTLLQEGHTVTFRIKGWSMRPFLENSRDKVLLMPVSRQICVNDVVLALSDDNRYLLHRIISIDDDGKCVLRGDGNAFGTETCTKDNILGIAKGFYRGEKEEYYDCEGRVWKFYSRFWMFCSPIRRYLLFITRVLFKLKLL